MKGGLGKGEMCAVCVYVFGGGIEGEVKEREGPPPPARSRCTRAAR